MFDLDKRRAAMRERMAVNRVLRNSQEATNKAKLLSMPSEPASGTFALVDTVLGRSLVVGGLSAVVKKFLKRTGQDQFYPFHESEEFIAGFFEYLYKGRALERYTIERCAPGTLVVWR